MTFWDCCVVRIPLDNLRICCDGGSNNAETNFRTLGSSGGLFNSTTSSNINFSTGSYSVGMALYLLCSSGITVNVNVLGLLFLFNVHITIPQVLVSKTFSRLHTPGIGNHLYTILSGVISTI